MGPAGPAGVGSGGGFPDTYTVTVYGSPTVEQIAQYTTYIQVAYCHSGDTVIAGGFSRHPKEHSTIKILDSYPILDSQLGQGWRVTARLDGSNDKWTTWALCGDTYQEDDL